MDVYLASPNNQVQAAAAIDMPVLFSFACYSPWIDSYQQSFGKLLIDSGAYSEFTSGKKVCIDSYADWSCRWKEHAEAIAGVDDIAGDWRKSMRNYNAVPYTFPTIHDSDPPELLKDLVDMCTERKTWLGLGLTLPRQGKENFVRWVCDNVPKQIHIHGWACRAYTKVRRLDSVDSTNWWRDAFALRVKNELSHLTYAECLEIIVKRYKRWDRVIDNKKSFSTCEPDLFDGIEAVGG
jgi:hypothetical protein